MGSTIDTHRSCLPTVARESPRDRACFTIIDPYARRYEIVRIVGYRVPRLTMQGFAANSLACPTNDHAMHVHRRAATMRRRNAAIQARSSWRAPANVRELPIPSAGTEDTMTTFDKREEGFEKKFAHDAELQFKANARRNKLLGLWAAEKLGMSGAEADAYAKAVIMADFDEPGDGDVFKKIRTDFDAKGVTLSDQQIRRTMDELLAKAVADVKATG
jgi:hypothetical protein